MKTFIARYFDGETAKPYSVSVQLQEDGLAVVFIDSELPPLMWPKEEIVVKEKPYHNLPAIICHEAKQKATLTIEKKGQFKQIAKEYPQLQYQHSGVFLNWSSLLVLIVIAGIFISVVIMGMPYAANHIAKVMPTSWKESLGDYVENSFFANANICTSPSATAALNTLTERLAQGAANQSFNIKIIDFDSVNAVTLPGGRILIFSGLIKAVDSADELAGVIAHEMGHSIHAHPTAGLIRELGFSILFAAITGTASPVGSQLLSLKYSRNNELIADEVGVDLLNTSQISSQGFVNFFEKLAKIEKGDTSYAQASELMSTHPLSQSRIERIKSLDTDQAVNTPALNEKDWQALQKACH